MSDRLLMMLEGARQDVIYEEAMHILEGHPRAPGWQGEWTLWEMRLGELLAEELGDPEQGAPVVAKTA